MVSIHSGVCRILEKGGEGRKFENNEDHKKRFSLGFSPIFCPGLGGDQKKNGAMHPPKYAPVDTNIMW